LHGGTVAADSAGENCGATFTVRFPAMVATGQEFSVTELEPSPAVVVESRERTQALRGLRVLVVDDEFDARLLVATMLEGSGAQVLAVASTAEALDSMETWKPDVLIADIGMPLEDGYSLIRKVRALPHERGGRTPALALTAYARDDDRKRALSEGYQVHLAKPVDRVELASAIAGLRQV
jgi:CheY-like chemotaxis protein